MWYHFAYDYCTCTWGLLKHSHLTMLLTAMDNTKLSSLTIFLSQKFFHGICWISYNLVLFKIQPWKSHAKVMGKVTRPG